jgi:hypothetical protein
MPLDHEAIAAMRCRRFGECGRSIEDGWVILQESEDGEPLAGVCLWHFAMEKRSEGAAT